VTLVGIVVILALVLLPVAIMLWRFHRGDELVSGGSFGSQLAHRDRDRRP